MAMIDVQHVSRHFKLKGKGRRTMIAVLTTLLLPSSGSAYVAGHDVVTERDAVRKQIGIIFQDSTLDNKLTAAENLHFHGVLYGLSKAERQKRIDELLAMVELSDRAHTEVKQFSGGMKRRLEIARGLMHFPKILFLDEPTLGLDPQTRAHIWTYIERVRRERHMTIFMTTHYLDEVEDCDRVSIIDAGKIVALDTPNALKQHYHATSMNQVFLEATGHNIRRDEL